MTTTIAPNANTLQNVISTQTGNSGINTTGATNTTNNPASPASSTSTSTTTGSTASSVSATAQQALSQNFSDYLTLLTTQLQNQDPTQPMDTNQMTQQIASLSQVEQQITTNNSLASLLAAYNNSQINGSVNYIGARIEATGSSTALQGGQSDLVYSLAAPADSVSVTIKDSTGNTVYTGASSGTASGRNVMTWDGQNSITGSTAPDGTYTYAVTATDAAGNPVAATTYTTGVVQSVDVSNGTPTMDLGNGLTVPLSSLTKIEPNATGTAQAATN